MARRPTSTQVLVDPDGAWLDPQHAVSGRMARRPRAAARRARRRGRRDRPTDRLGGTAGARPTRGARAAIDDLLDGWDEPFEGRVARDVVGAVPDGASLVVASSMPVRDVESFAAPRDGVALLANRGVNGIDGFVSTVLGVAAGVRRADGRAARRPVLPARQQRPARRARPRASTPRSSWSTTTAVASSRSCPQAELPEHFETLFGTPHGVDLAALAAVHGIAGRRGRAGRGDARAARCTTSVDAGGVRVVLVRTDRATNVTRHREVWAAVADSLSRLSTSGVVYRISESP